MPSYDVSKYSDPPVVPADINCEPCGAIMFSLLTTCIDLNARPRRPLPAPLPTVHAAYLVRNRSGVFCLALVHSPSHLVIQIEFLFSADQGWSAAVAQFMCLTCATQ